MADDLKQHTRNKGVMQELTTHLGEDVSEVGTEALFETSAKVIKELIDAFSDFEKRNEEAW